MSFYSLIKMVDLEFYLEFHDYLKIQKDNGKKIIAFLSHDNIPEELIAAAGFIPLRIIFAGSDELMDKGADINTRSNQGGTPLSCSAYKGNKQILQLLIDNDVDINPDVENPLYVAALKGHILVIRLLLERGADFFYHSGCCFF